MKIGNWKLKIGAKGFTPTPKPKFFGVSSQSERGFTLVELMVVISVFTLLSGLVLISFRTGGMGASLQRDSIKLSQNLRKVEEMSIAAKEFSGTVPVDGCSNCYGIYLNPGNSTEIDYYIIFADTNRNYVYDGSAELVEQISLEEKNIIKGPISYKKSNGTTKTVKSITIVFIPPDPTVVIDKDSTNLETTITLNDKSSGKSKNVLVNRAGLINVQE